jgi:hypothetical protein
MEGNLVGVFVAVQSPVMAVEMVVVQSPHLPDNSSSSSNVCHRI